MGKQTDKAENDYFRFSDEQWDKLKGILGKYETGTGKGLSSNVNRFILVVEMNCSTVKKLTTWPEYRDNQENIDSLKKHLRKALKILNPSAIDSSGELKNAEARPFSISAYSQTYCYETEGSVFAEILTKEQEFWKRANNATLAIMNLLAILEDSARFMERKKRKKGEMPADYDGFVYSIAKSFHQHFSKMPTSYPGGPFMEVVRIALEVIGRPFNHPERTVEEAIKRLKAEIL